jgi:hypothetical protein
LKLCGGSIGSNRATFVSFLKVLLLENLFWTSGVVLVKVVLQLQEIDHCSVTLLIFYILRLCASVLPLGLCVVVEAGCNWYLYDINILFIEKLSGDPLL